MNSRTSFALLAVLTAVGTLTAMSSAYAVEDLPQPCVGCPIEDAREAAEKMLLEDIPISVWTDKTDYGHSDMIMVKGHVANLVSGFPVTITVVSPLNSIVTVDQVNVSDDGTFETALNTAGAMWKYDGTYTIKANYGSAEKADSAKVEITGGVAYTPTYDTPNVPDRQCRSMELSVGGHCVPFTITGGMITGATVNSDDNSIVIGINAQEDGMLTVSPKKTTLDGAFMVLVDGEEWDDSEIAGEKITVMFPAGAEEIEIIGTFVVPEFGTIAVMVLAVAIISIVAISARSGLSIVPRRF